MRFCGDFTLAFSYFCILSIGEKEEKIKKIKKDFSKKTEKRYKKTKKFEKDKLCNREKGAKKLDFCIVNISKTPFSKISKKT